jgi:DNA polymerase-3 subunit epsilon
MILSLVSTKKGLIMDRVKDKQEVIQLSKQYVKQNPIYLDTETTGLDYEAEIVNISIIDSDGKVLFDSLIKPIRAIPSDATRVHGITNQMVRNAPTWREVWPSIQSILRGRLVGIYNAEYDIRLIKQSCEKNGLYWSPPYSNAFCIMLLFSKYYGAWDDYHQSYTWQKLEFAGKLFNINIPNSHRAKDDTLLSRAVLHCLAGEDYQTSNNIHSVKSKIYNPLTSDGVFQVPEFYKTIGSAYINSSKGNTIDVGEGNYSINIHIRKQINIIGRKDKEVNFFPRVIGKPILYFDEVECQVEISNIYFGIIDKQLNPFGIIIKNSNVYIKNCIFYFAENDLEYSSTEVGFDTGYGFQEGADYENPYYYLDNTIMSNQMGLIYKNNVKKMPKSAIRVYGNSSSVVVENCVFSGINTTIYGEGKFNIINSDLMKN